MPDLGFAPWGASPRIFRQTIQHQWRRRSSRCKGLAAIERWRFHHPHGLRGASKVPRILGVRATKAAIRNFVRAWTLELKDRRIRSNVLSPGPTVTPLVDQQPPDAIARIVSSIPMGRMANPDEIAKAALFLASDDSSFVTGIELFVDGGRAQV